MIDIKPLTLEDVQFILDGAGRLKALPKSAMSFAFYADVDIGIKAKPGKINPADEDRDFRVVSMTIGTQDITDSAIRKHIFDTLWDHYEEVISGHVEEELSELEGLA